MPIPPPVPACLRGSAPQRGRHRRPSPVALAAALCLSALLGPRPVAAQPAEPAPPPALVLQPSTALEPLPDGGHGRQRPTILRAGELRLRPDLDAVATGGVEFRHAGTVIRADRLSYDNASDTAHAQGQVQVERPGARYRGPELQLRVQRFEGFFLQPEFEFLTLGSGGRAERIDFIDASRSQARQALYSSCPREDGVEPDWLLRTRRVTLDFDTNVGVAEGAVLQFLGVPILGLPVLSFPLSDDRKSGWLPPSVGLDSRSGFEFGVPYYWNIAANRDATITPTVSTRRGASLETEFRFLEARQSGQLRLHLLPRDMTVQRARGAWLLASEGDAGYGLRYLANWRHVSDDAYWKDFPRLVSSTSPRLLAQDLRLDRSWSTPLGPASAYARVQQWQVLQTGSGDDLIVAPYQRSPQLGATLAPELPGGLRAALQTELNHFTRPDLSASAALPTGWRWHALGQISRPWLWPGAWLTPKLALNAAAYDLDPSGSGRSSRLIPTASVDAGLVFDRASHWFGRSQRQTLEPRLLYVNTPYRDQAALPNFDAADRDFNAVSIYAENAFSGVDRVSDAHQLTAGVTTRLVDDRTGVETLRLGLAQRFRLRDQRVVLSGGPLSRRFSDLLVDASSSALRPWQFDAALQYNPDSSRIERAIVSTRYSPEPFRTVSVGYRVARGLSEQFEFGWQWPVYRGTARPVGASSGCGGTLYAVGRVNYSLRDSRATDSLVGVEYDTGCWIGRVVAERLSTGRAEATTRLLLQLELVGLSRLGSNPLQALKDNVPGYRLLRDPRAAQFPFVEP